MQWLTVTVCISLAASCVLADDDCKPGPKGEHKVFVQDCCKLDIMPTSMETSVKKCFEKFPPKAPGPPPPGPPSAEMKNAHACVAECLFTEEGLLTSDKQVDKEAAIKYFSTKSPEVAPAVKAAVEECYDSYMADVDPTLECKSGAEHFKRCLIRQLFLNCPSSSYSASADCDEFRAKAKKCPKMPVMFMKPPGGPH